MTKAELAFHLSLAHGIFTPIDELKKWSKHELEVVHRHAIERHGCTLLVGAK